METNPLRVGGTAMENAYIRQIEAERLRRNGAEGERRALRADLGAELEIDDACLLEDLIRLGITPETAPAFQALPLVEVAWADGAVDAEERWRVLGIATAFGLELGSPGHAQLELWLAQRPTEELFDAWYRFAGSLARNADVRSDRLIEGAREVAVAAGGLLGFGAVSACEGATIERIREALGGPAVNAS